MEEKKDFVTALIKTGLWIWLSLLGFIAKISIDTLNERQLTRLQWAAVLGLCIVAGHMMNEFCSVNGLDAHKGWIITFTALYSERIVVWLGENLNDILKRFITPKKE